MIKKFKRSVFNEIDETFICFHNTKYFNKNFVFNTNKKFRIYYDILFINNESMIEFTQKINWNQYKFYINLNKRIDCKYDIYTYDVLKKLNTSGLLLYKTVIISTVIYIIKLYNSVEIINEDIMKNLYFYDKNTSYELYFLFLEDYNPINNRKNRKFKKR